MQLLGAAAVFKTGGPACPLWMGRRDSGQADKHVTNLPSPCAGAYLAMPDGTTPLYNMFSE